MPDQPAPKTLHQQTVDYTVQAVAQREARLTVLDLLVLDLRAQLAAAHAHIGELEAVAEAADIIAGTPA